MKQVHKPCQRDLLIDLDGETPIAENIHERYIEKVYFYRGMTYYVHFSVSGRKLLDIFHESIPVSSTENYEG